MKTLLALFLFVVVAFPALPPPYLIPHPSDPTLPIGPPRPASINEFRPIPVVPKILPDYLVPPNIIRYLLPDVDSPLDVVAHDAKGTFHEVPSIVLTSMPPRLKWQGEENKSYRVVVSNDGTNFTIVNSQTKMFRRQFSDSDIVGFWSSWEVTIPLPSNRFFKVVSP